MMRKTITRKTKRKFFDVLRKGKREKTKREKRKRKKENKKQRKRKEKSGLFVFLCFVLQ